MADANRPMALMERAPTASTGAGLEIVECSEWSERVVRAMGSPARLIAGDCPAAVLEWALTELARLEGCWSRFDVGSELTRLNRSAGKWFEMSPVMQLAVDRAIELTAMTHGRFDPGVLPALVSSGYDRTFAAVSAASVRDAQCSVTRPPAELRLAGRIERDGQAVRLPVGTAIDLGGVGKGLAADLVADGLVERGARSVCVSLGGDLRLAGGCPHATGWPIPITDPLDDTARLGSVRVRSGAIVTSTTRYRRWQRGDREFHHLIDPSTMQPSRSGVAAVIVMASDAWRAEGLAKAALIAGTRAGVELLDSAGVAGWLVGDDGRVLATPSAPEMET